MKNLGKFIDRLRPAQSALEALLTSNVTSLGALTNRGHDLERLIASEKKGYVLRKVVEIAKPFGDLKWSIAAGKRLLKVEPNDDSRLDYVRNLIWAQHFETAQQQFKSVTENVVDPALYVHTSFLLDVWREDFVAAKVSLAKLDKLQPDESFEYHGQLILRLIAVGRYEDAKAQLALSMALYSDSAVLVAADVRLALIFDGTEAALDRLAQHALTIGVKTEAYKSIYANTLLEMGRYNEVFELTGQWIDDNPKQISLYGPCNMAASHCDRQDEFGGILAKMSKRYPNSAEILELQCNWAIDQNNWDQAKTLRKQVYENSHWSGRSIDLAMACQQPDSGKVLETYTELETDGIKFPGPSIMLAFYIYFYQAANGGIAKARDLIAPYLYENMGDSGFLALHLRLLIAEGLDDEASGFYTSLPKGLASTAPLAPFQMYFQAMSGQHEEARNGWREYLVTTAHMSINARSSYPTTVKLRYTEKPEDVLLFLTVFNGIEFVDWFLDYYRNLGVDHFFIVDNGSDDGTLERLLEEKDVSVFENTGSFSASACGVFWTNHLMRRFGVGHWCFHVDMDEAFVYPEMQNGKTLHNLLAYMDENNYQSIPSLMLDIYPESLVADPEDDPFKSSKYIDSDYFSMRSELPPYNFIQGGIRARLSGRSLLMTKAPLVKMSADVSYIANNHQHTHLRFSDVSSALLHYKFIGDFIGRVDEAIERQEHFMGARFYRAMRSEMEGPQSHVALKSDFSVEYRDPKQLEDMKLIKNSADWTNFNETVAIISDSK